MFLPIAMFLLIFLLKQQWFLSKEMLKLTDDKSIKVYALNIMGLIRTL